MNITQLNKQQYTIIDPKINEYIQSTAIKYLNSRNGNVQPFYEIQAIETKNQINSKTMCILLADRSFNPHLQQFQMDNQRKVVDYFKQFVNTVLIKYFSSSEETIAEWNYFSSLMTQEMVDFDKVNVYLNFISTSSNSQIKSIPDPRLLEEKKTNSGIYKKDAIGGDSSLDFALNRTVGGNADRIKFTGMLPARTNYPTYNFESKDKRPKTHNRLNPGMFALVEGIEQVYNRMSDNHNKMQMQYSKPLTIQLKPSQETNGVGNGNYFFKQKFEERIF